MQMLARSKYKNNLQNGGDFEEKRLGESSEGSLQESGSEGNQKGRSWCLKFLKCQKGREIELNQNQERRKKKATPGGICQRSGSKREEEL